MDVMQEYGFYMTVMHIKETYDFVAIERNLNEIFQSKDVTLARLRQVMGQNEAREFLDVEDRQYRDIQVLQVYLSDRMKHGTISLIEIDLEYLQTHCEDIPIETIVEEEMYWDIHDQVFAEVEGAVRGDKTTVLGRSCHIRADEKASISQMIFNHEIARMVIYPSAREYHLHHAKTGFMQQGELIK